MVAGRCGTAPAAAVDQAAADAVGLARRARRPARRSWRRRARRRRRRRSRRSSRRAASAVRRVFGDSGSRRRACRRPARAGGPARAAARRRGSACPRAPPGCASARVRRCATAPARSIDGGEVGEVVDLQQRRRGAEDDRREGRRGDAGQRRQRGRRRRCGLRRRAVAHLVVDHQQAEGLAARRCRTLPRRSCGTAGSGRTRWRARGRGRSPASATFSTLTFSRLARSTPSDQPGEAAPGAFQPAQARHGAGWRRAARDSIASIAAMSRSSASRSACGSMRSGAPRSAPNHGSIAPPASAREEAGDRVGQRRHRGCRRSGRTAWRRAPAAAARPRCRHGAAAAASTASRSSFTAACRACRGACVGDQAVCCRDARHHAQAGGQLLHLQPRAADRRPRCRSRACRGSPCTSTLASRSGIAGLHLLARRSRCALT